LSYELAFNLTSYLHRERDYVPWAAFFDAVGFIAGMLSTSDAHGPLQVIISLTGVIQFQGRRSLWDRVDTPPPPNTWTGWATVVNVPPPIFEE